MCATFLVYVRSIESLDTDLFISLVCSYRRKPKEYFVSGCLKPDKVPGNRVFHTLDLETAFSFRGLRPLTPNEHIWTTALKHSKEYFVSACLKPEKVLENGDFHTLDLEKSISLRCPWTPPGAAEGTPLSDFLTFPHSHL